MLPLDTLHTIAEVGIAITGFAGIVVAIRGGCLLGTQMVGAEELTSWLSVYQLSRDMTPRGIVEVIFDD